MVNILPFNPALQDSENILHGLLRGRSLEGGMRDNGRDDGRVMGGMKIIPPVLKPLCTKAIPAMTGEMEIFS